MTSISRTTVLYLALALTALAGCAVNPATGRNDLTFMSESQEIGIGRQMHGEILKEMPIYQDADIQNYVNKIGQAVAKTSHRNNLSYSFTVIDSPDINAFALPGGFIYINRGLLTYLNSEAELAAVLGHEIGHVTARHSVRQHSASVVATGVSAVLTILSGERAVGDLTNTAGAAIVSGYGRDHELEADSLGAEYLFNAGYDPQAMIKVIGVLKDQEEFSRSKAQQEGEQVQSYHGLFATHPRNDTRLQQSVAKAGKLSTKYKNTGEADFRKHIQGVEFGDSTQSGVRRANRFYHKPLGFTFAFPTGWKMQNTQAAVVVYPQQKDGFLQLVVENKIDNLTPERFARERLNVYNLKYGETFSQDGLIGYTGIIPATMKHPDLRLAVIFHQQRAYVFTGIRKSGGTLQQYDPFFMSTIKSFRPLKASEASLAEGKRIVYIKAKANTTYATLASGSSINEYPEEQLRLLNGDYPDGQPKAGAWIKIVK
jgi:predicted Zn-dependent protease